MKTKIYKNLNLVLLILFVVGTIWGYESLPKEIPLFMQSPNRNLFIGISFCILLLLAVFSFYPQKMSGSTNAVRNEITTVVLNFLGIGIILYYFVIVARYSGFEINHLKLIALILGGMMILIGNLLPQMPFESRIGFKLPWILKDKLYWQKTHRFAGYTAIPFGILQCILVLFVKNSNWALLPGIGAWIILVCIYSIIISAEKKQK
nr:SdpI family protein [uncultured Sellimonas sp.]